MAGTDGLQQPRYTQARVGAQFQRVQKFIIQPLEQAVHRLQSAQRLQVQALVAHRQVAALDQGQAQVARQVGVLEIGFVVRARREQRNVGVLAGRALAFQVVNQRSVGRGQPLHVERRERLRVQARNGDAVFQQVAQSGWCLRALRHHPPVAVRSARQIEGGDVQMRGFRRQHAVRCTQVARVALHQRRRHQALGQQALRSIGVSHQAVEHTGALFDAGFDLLPALGRDDQRKQVQRPGALRMLGVGVDVVGDAVVTDLALQAFVAPVQVIPRGVTQVVKKFAPGLNHAAIVGVRRSVAGAAAQFIEVAAGGPHRQRIDPCVCAVLVGLVKEAVIGIHG